MLKRGIHEHWFILFSFLIVIFNNFVYDIDQLYHKTNAVGAAYQLAVLRWFNAIKVWPNAIKVRANAIKVWPNAIKVWPNAIKIRKHCFRKWII